MRSDTRRSLADLDKHTLACIVATLDGEVAGLVEKCANLEAAVEANEGVHQMRDAYDAAMVEALYRMGVEARRTFRDGRPVWASVRLHPGTTKRPLSMTELVKTRKDRHPELRYVVRGEETFREITFRRNPAYGNVVPHWAPTLTDASWPTLEVVLKPVAKEAPDAAQ